MDTLSAFAMGKANRGKEMRVFDWNKAAQIIKDRGCREASAGLSSDLEWTEGTIFENGQPLKERVGAYLASTWAKPVLVIDGEEIDCWIMESQTDGWDAYTHWPESALAIFSAA